MVWFIKYYFTHAPSVHDFTPAHAATQALPYVFPSQPQTGLYSIVHIQSVFATPRQSLPVFVVLHAVKSKVAPNKNLKSMVDNFNFSIQFFLLKILFYFYRFLSKMLFYIFYMLTCHKFEYAKVRKLRYGKLDRR